MPMQPRLENAGLVRAVGVGVFVLLLACFPLALAVDEQVDRQRPMFHDREAMEWLQYQSLVATGSGVPLSISEGDSAVVNGESFTPSAGVAVEVRLTDDGVPCVQVENEHGDRSRWACVDESDPPRDPDAGDEDPVL